MKKRVKEPGLIKVEGWYDTPTVQHCHNENHVCFAYEEAGRVVVVTSTQIPHIVRRIVGQALGIPWGKVPNYKGLISAGDSATSRTPCTSLSARIYPHSWAADW